MDPSFPLAFQVPRTGPPRNLRRIPGSDSRRNRQPRVSRWRVLAYAIWATRIWPPRV